MESLETKIERLPPELQKEVEDFVDFLAARHASGEARASVTEHPPEPEAISEIPFFARDEPSPPPYDFPNPPETDPVMFAADEMKQHEDAGITRNYLDYGAFEENEPVKRIVRKTKPSQGARGKPAPQILDWIE